MSDGPPASGVAYPDYSAYDALYGGAPYRDFRYEWPSVSDRPVGGGSYRPNNLDVAVPIIASIISGGFGLYGQGQQEAADRRAGESNAQLQREFAQMGIRWRVEDARRAGIHPLAALGAHVSSPSPSFISSDSSTAWRQMGQDFSRAIQSTRTNTERQEAAANLALENAKLQNDLLRVQIKQIDQVPPALPDARHMIDGQGNAYVTSSAVVPQPLRPTSSEPGAPARDVGAVPDYAFARTRRGYAVVPSKDVKERVEDQIVPEILWALRNHLVPAISGLDAPDPRRYPLPEGFDHWKWSPLHQEFRPAKYKSIMRRN